MPYKEALTYKLNKARKIEEQLRKKGSLEDERLHYVGLAIKHNEKLLQEFEDDNE